MKWLEQIAEETNTSVPEVIRAAIEHAQETKKKSWSDFFFYLDWKFPPKNVPIKGRKGDDYALSELP